ncbi:ly6/PLAUR domain-containing protein 1-like [Ptychodera flava]|uniref:ly6/PLAUR domain-containing protein 1-like n=1 Tax=Ptychodera flava TaxID=63121 RepID=UPI003969DF20
MVDMAKVVILLAVSISLTSALQCFTCEYENNNQNCQGTNAIKTCSQTQDRCLTQTIWSSTRDKLRIDKSCASQAGCQDATEQLAKSYWCDSSKGAWGCVECCNTDLCNLSRTSTQHGVSLTTIVFTVLFTVLCLH